MQSIYIHEQLHETPAHARVNDCLDLLIGAIRKVGEGPAGVSQHIIVLMEEQAG